MKVILSRKGFDSTNCGQQSPILVDCTLLSLPIPEHNAQNTTYKDVGFCDKSYYDIIKEFCSQSVIAKDKPCTSTLILKMVVSRCIKSGVHALDWGAP